MEQTRQQDTIVVRTRLTPRYYEEFQCLAGACRDTCCAGWSITFSKKDYLKIKRAHKPPEVEELTRQAMRRLPRRQTHYAEFLAKEGPCPFQSAEGLCRLQLACGAETLPEVCQQFPRHDLYTAMGHEYAGRGNRHPASSGALSAPAPVGGGAVAGPCPTELGRLFSVRLAEAGGAAPRGPNADQEIDGKNE